MEQIIIIDKQKKYLNENSSFGNIPELTSEICCIHCDKQFYKVENLMLLHEDGDEFTCRPNATLTKFGNSYIDSNRLK